MISNRLLQLHPVSVRFCTRNICQRSLASGNWFCAIRVCPSIIDRCSNNILCQNKQATTSSFIHTTVQWASKKSKHSGGRHKSKKHEQSKSELRDDDEQLSPSKTVSMEDEMESMLDVFREKLVQETALRSDVRAFQNLSVTMPDGSCQNMDHLAQIVQKSPQLLMLNFAARPDALPPARDEILRSALNINPQQEGNNLMIPLIRVTQEHREQLVKNAKVLYNKFKDELSKVHKERLKALQIHLKTHKMSKNEEREILDGYVFNRKNFEKSAEKLVEERSKQILQQL